MDNDLVKKKYYHFNLSMFKQFYKIFRQLDITILKLNLFSFLKSFIFNSSDLQKKVVFVSSIFLLQQIVLAQHSEPSEVTAYRINEKVIFDGKLDEIFWDKAQHITNFTQRDLSFGEPITEKTEVAILYDENTLYVGIWCYQKEMNKLVAKEMSRDFDYESEDNFQLMISPYNDNRTGYLFVVNPNGARGDAQIYGGEDANEDWNGVWDAKTTVTQEGWFTEIYIPFSTLQFKKESTMNWAINFERDIVSKNEQALWQGWSRDNSIYAVNNAGKLLAINNVAYAKRFEFKPYGLVGWQYQQDEESSYPLKAGADLNVSLSPTLKLNLTTFTDFAQVEADRIPVNLSRFSVFYPEKRQFFLEGSNNFSYYLGDHNSAFYTREIGKENGQIVPIIAGARVFGKIGGDDIGILNIQEGKTKETLETNNTVIRYKHNLGKQSYIGGIFTNKINDQSSNQVAGIDATYQTSEFLHNKNLIVGAKLTSSMENFEWKSNSLSYRIYADYPNDLIDNFMAISSMQSGFNPELGYIRRTNYNSYSWYFRLSPRVFSQYGVKRLMLKPWGFTLYQTQSTGELESFSNEIRPLGVALKTGDRFEVNFIQNFDRIDQPFDITDEIIIPQGKYWMYQYEVQFETYQARRLWTELRYRWGQFYTGTIRTFDSEVGLNINKHFNINGSYTYNWVNMKEGNVITNEVALYLNYAFSTKIDLSLFSQYNDLDEFMLYNIRLHWIPEVGSDFYFVYNFGYDEPIKQIDYLKPHRTDAVMKLVYRFVF